MKDRIKYIVDSENISYTKFAEILGIQRSGISHIINGRNKPSLEVIQKILENFEYINSDWLLFGKGNMKKNDFIETQGNLFSENISDIVENEEDKEDIKKNKSLSSELSDDLKKSTEIKLSDEVKISNKKIEKIVILYSDKSFSEYKPE